MPVLSEGAASSAACEVLAYSNSKPSTSTPAPTAKPLTVRLAGDVLAPMNSVASAHAVAGANAISVSARIVTRVLLMQPPGTDSNMNACLKGDQRDVSPRRNVGRMGS